MPPALPVVHEKLLLLSNFMTRVQIHFRLQKQLDDDMLQRISDAYAIYGIQKVQVSPSRDALMVEYDATRLRPAEVESAFTAAGIPVQPA